MPWSRSDVPIIIRTNKPDPYRIWQIMAELMTEYSVGGDTEYYIESISADKE